MEMCVARMTKTVCFVELGIKNVGESFTAPSFDELPEEVQDEINAETGTILFIPPSKAKAKKKTEEELPEVEEEEEVPEPPSEKERKRTTRTTRTRRK
jgi:hypothetical protein